MVLVNINSFHYYQPPNLGRSYISISGPQTPVFLSMRLDETKRILQLLERAGISLEYFTIPI